MRVFFLRFPTLRFIAEPLLPSRYLVKEWVVIHDRKNIEEKCIWFSLFCLFFVSTLQHGYFFISLFIGAGDDAIRDGPVADLRHLRQPLSRILRPLLEVRPRPPSNQSTNQQKQNQSIQPMNDSSSEIQWFSWFPIESNRKLLKIEGNNSEHLKR